MSIIYLTTDDFYIPKNENPSDHVKLCIKMRGLSFIYFSSNNCKFCDEFLPVFKSLPKVIGGCHFGTINVSNNMNIVKASMKSTTPIKYVPYCIMYIDGVPFMRYDGTRNIEQIKTFVFEIAGRLQRKSGPVVRDEFGTVGYGKGDGGGGGGGGRNQRGVRHSDGDDKVPVYNMGGKPKNSEEVCFLTLNSAYN